jgi:hypothetical protein
MFELNDFICVPRVESSAWSETINAGMLDGAGSSTMSNEQQESSASSQCLGFIVDSPPCCRRSNNVDPCKDMLLRNVPFDHAGFFRCQLQELLVSFLSTDPICTIHVRLRRRNGPSVSCFPNIVNCIETKRFARNGKQVIQGGLDVKSEAQGETVWANELWLDGTYPNRDGQLVEVEIERERDEGDQLCPQIIVPSIHTTNEPMCQ